MAAARSWVADAFRWLFAPLVDGWHGLSLTRFLAIYFALLVGHLTEATHTLPANALWLSLAAIAAAFGKTTFTFLLSRMESRATVSQSDARTETISRVIQERRGSFPYEAAP